MFRLLRLWRLAAKDLPRLWFAMRHPDRPAWLWPAVLGLAAYALDPFNLAIPALGFVDDFVLLPLLIHWIIKLLPPQIRAGMDRGTLLR